MGISSSQPTSRRGYLSASELEQFADITVIDADEAADQISQAEEIIDSYVGAQDRFMQGRIDGRATAGSSTTLTLRAQDQNTAQKDFFIGCEIELIGGTGAGQRRRISTSSYAGVITVADAWTTTPDSTTFYKIYQLGKFPRCCDVSYYSETSPEQYYKSIPEAVKRAVAAQVEYIINMGSGFFSTDQSEKASESIGDYSYSLGSGANSPGAGVTRLIAPKAKILLRGIKNRTGQIV